MYIKTKKIDNVEVDIIRGSAHWTEIHNILYIYFKLLLYYLSFSSFSNTKETNIDSTLGGAHIAQTLQKARVV